MCNPNTPSVQTKHCRQPRRGSLRLWKRRKFRRQSMDNTKAAASHQFPSLGHTECPPLFTRINEDVFADIMAFAGNKAVSSFAKVSKDLNKRCDSQDVWRKLSECTGKWSTGNDEQPKDWKEYYQMNPIVPYDFSTLQGALKATPRRIIVADDVLDVFSTLEVSSSVIIEGRIQAFVEHEERATIRSDVPRDSPAIRLLDGAALIMKNMDLFHHSFGGNIREGNAALYSQSQTTLTLVNCSVASMSGRGIHMSHDAGRLTLTDSSVRNCAATGIYLHGENFSATLRNSAVVNNGRGNHVYHGVTSGHSGIRLESGHLQLIATKVVRNIGTPISRGWSESIVEETDTVVESRRESHPTYFDYPANEAHDAAIAAYLERYA